MGGKQCFDFSIALPESQIVKRLSFLNGNTVNDRIYNYLFKRLAKFIAQYIMRDKFEEV